MVGTFSVNIGQITEATSFPIQDYLEDLLNELRDNEDRLISPLSLRNSIISLWTSVPFKETKTGTYSYIGIDSSNDTDRDIKRTIFLGKRSFSGTFSYLPSHDIMNTSLLNSDVDIFLYNTKKDTVSNTSTRVTLLAGINSSLYNRAPYIQGSFVSGLTPSLSINLVSRSGNLDIESKGIGGSFSLNSLYIPNRTESTGSASTNKLWIYKDSKLIWDELRLPPLSHIGVTGSTLNIFGSQVNVNSHPLEFTDDRFSTNALGDIPLGTTFSNVAISEVLRRMIYTYLPPLCSISIDKSFAEVGTFVSPVLSYTITKRTNNTLTTGLTNMIPGSYPPITDGNQVTVSATASGIVIGQLGTNSTTFKITVKDTTNFIVSATASITGIYPYFYGFSQLLIPNTILGSLNKKIETKSNKVIDIFGNENFYFIYDKKYGELSGIFDNVGNNLITNGSFTSSTRFLSSPSGNWINKEFFVYQWNNVPQTTTSINYEFRY